MKVDYKRIREAIERSEETSEKNRLAKAEEEKKNEEEKSRLAESVSDILDRQEVKELLRRTEKEVILCSSYNPASFLGGRPNYALLTDGEYVIEEKRGERERIMKLPAGISGWRKVIPYGETIGPSFYDEDFKPNPERLVEHIELQLKHILNGLQKAT